MPLLQGSFHPCYHLFNFDRDTAFANALINKHGRDLEIMVDCHNENSVLPTAALLKYFDLQILPEQKKKIYLDASSAHLLPQQIKALKQTYGLVNREDLVEFFKGHVGLIIIDNIEDHTILKDLADILSAMRQAKAQIIYAKYNKASWGISEEWVMVQLPSSGIEDVSSFNRLLTGMAVNNAEPVHNRFRHV